MGAALLVVLAGLSWAQEDEGGTVGRFALEPTPGYRVESFPRTHPMRVELGVYDNRADLDAQLEVRSAKWLTEADAISVGGGIWFVSLFVERPDIEVTWAMDEAERLIVSLSPGQPSLSPEIPEPDVAALLEGHIPRRPAVVGERALHPLEGDAQSLLMRPGDLPLEIPTWTPPPSPPPWDALLAPVPPTWEAVDDYRQTLASSGSERAQAAATYRLALAHMDLGLPREALYYLGRLERTGRAPASVVALERARAHLALRQWDEARGACSDAVRAGSTTEESLLCLASVSLYTAEPPPTETARALVRHTNGNHRARLLAAELLLSDRRAREAMDLLEPTVVRLEGRSRALAWANLGDARFATGDSEGAYEAWHRAYNHDNPHDPLVDMEDRLFPEGQLRRRPRSVRDTLGLRLVMLEMAEAGPEGWAAHVPELEQLAAMGGAMGAEAHYLLAQVASAYDDQEMAALHLGALIDEHRELALRSNAPDRLLGICARRLDWLLVKGDDAEAVAFYRDYWRPELDELVVDPAPVEGVARALERLGLPHQALDVQRSVTAIHLRYGYDEPRALLTLARLYASSGRAEEAREAIAYTRELPASRGLGGRLDLLQGHALRALEDEAGAVAAYGRAARDEAVRPEATAHLALLRADADLCAQALPPLRAALALSPPLEQVLREDVGLATARCLLETGALAEALDVSGKVAAASQDPGTRARARYLAGVAAARGGPALPEALIPPSPLWEALVEEEAAQAAFVDRIER